MVVSVVQSATSDTVLALSFVVNVHVPSSELPNGCESCCRDCKRNQQQHHDETLHLKPFVCARTARPATWFLAGITPLLLAIPITAATREPILDRVRRAYPRPARNDVTRSGPCRRDDPICAGRLAECVEPVSDGRRVLSRHAHARHVHPGRNDPCRQPRRRRGPRESSRATQACPYALRRSGRRCASTSSKASSRSAARFGYRSGERGWVKVRSFAVISTPWQAAGYGEAKIEKRRPDHDGLLR